MASSARYSALEHAGLEVAEVVPASSPPWERRSSLNQPEAVHPTDYRDQPRGHIEYYGDRKAEAATPPSHVDGEKRDDVVPVNSTDGSEPGRRRRICGMPWKMFMVVVILIVLCLVGAVLGGVLGSILPKKSSKSSPAQSTPSGYPSTSSLPGADTPLQAMNKTGLATAILASDNTTLLSYFQDPTGRIIENSYSNNAWSTNNTNLNDSVVTDQATFGSPLAAISYPQGDLTYRQVFFFSGQGKVMTTNTTSTVWSTPFPITEDVVSPNAIGLAACWGVELLNGIRVYYGSNQGYIQEVGWQFTDTVWTAWVAFDNSDMNSGVACSIYQDASQSDDQGTSQQNNYVNVYLRDVTTGMIQQNYWTSDGTGWHVDGPVGWSNETVLPGSDIAVCSDDQNTEYVFYPIQGQLVTRGIVEPYAAYFGTYINMQGASPGSKLAAAYVDQGALLLFQNSSSDSTMLVSNVNRNGVSITNAAVP